MLFRSNLKIFNLRVDPDNQPLMRADSVQLSLEGMQKGIPPPIPGLSELIGVKDLHIVRMPASGGEAGKH